MLRADYRESIAQVVSGIRDMPSLEGRSKAAIAQAVVLRLLVAAGWDVFDLSQVMPRYITGNSNVDFALMSSGQPRGAVTPRMFIDVRTPGEDVGSPRMERQLLAHCAREEVYLAALTNGLRWLLFLWSPGGGRMERRFCEIDLRGDPEAAAADINRYLTRGRVSNGQAARSAERALRDSNREVVDRRAVIQGWRQVVGGLDEGLIELVATAAEQRAGHRPSNRLVRRVLAENRAALLAPGTEDAAGSGPGGGLRSTPSSFTLDSETRDVTSWSGLLVGVCLMMRDSHPGDFERILEIRGRQAALLFQGGRGTEPAPAHRGHGHFRLLPWDRGPDRRARPAGGGTLRTPCRVPGHPVAMTSESSFQLMMRR